MTFSLMCTDFFDSCAFVRAVVSKLYLKLLAVLLLAAHVVGELTCLLLFRTRDHIGYHLDRW